MSNDLLSSADRAEKNSTIAIIAISLVALLVEYIGLIESIARSTGTGVGPLMFVFAVVLNLGLVLYQVKAGKAINKLRNRPYL